MERKIQFPGFSENTLQRRSGIELLKLITLFVIVLSHCALNISLEAEMITIDSSNDLNNFLLIVTRHLGHICNDVFFICSAWFLLDTKKKQSQKAFRLAANIWVIYVMLLIFCVVDGRFPLFFSDYLKALLPTSFLNNWYASNYIFFLLIVLPLNSFLAGLSRKNHIRLLFVLSAAYLGIDYFFSTWGAQLFLGTHFTFWIYMYILIAYLKKYPGTVMNDVSLNVKLFIAAVVIRFGGIALINVGIAKFSLPNNLWMIWETKNDPFFLIMAIALFNIFRNFSFQSPVVNALSSLSLYIYVIHDNLLLKNSYRHLLFTKFINRLGKDNFSWKLLPIAALMFFKAILLSYVYRIALEKPVNTLADKIYAAAARWTGRCADRIIRRDEKSV